MTRVKGGGISLELQNGADIAVTETGGLGRCGVYQTDDGDSPVPAELMKLTQRWVKLTGKTKKD